MKLSLRYVDDVVKTVKDNPSVVLQTANKLQPKLQFTLETPYEKGDMAFEDININVDGYTQIK